MGSVFNKEANDRPTGRPSSLQHQGRRIDDIRNLEGEIGHLRNRSSVRGTLNATKTLAVWGILFGGLLGFFLYSYDALHFSLIKSTAFNAYVYLRCVDEGDYADALAHSEAITLPERILLDEKAKAFGQSGCSYYSRADLAIDDAKSVLAMIADYRTMSSGQVDKMTQFDRFRWRIFHPFGITPPLHWKILDPSTEDFHLFIQEPKEKDPNDVFKNI